MKNIPAITRKTATEWLDSNFPEEWRKVADRYKAEHGCDESTAVIATFMELTSDILGTSMFMQRVNASRDWETRRV